MDYLNRAGFPKVPFGLFGFFLRRQKFFLIFYVRRIGIRGGKALFNQFEINKKIIDPNIAQKPRILISIGNIFF